VAPPRRRRSVSASGSTPAATPNAVQPHDLGEDNASSDLEVYAQEVISALNEDNLPPTPNNYSLYFDRNLEKKSEALRKEISQVLEFEDSSDDEKQIRMEKSLKQGFTSIKSVLQVTATLYKNMALMSKILEKRQKEIGGNTSPVLVKGTITSLQGDLVKLSTIVKKQTDSMKESYQETADIVKDVENNTIFDNQYGVYNKRYLLAKLEQEANLIKKFSHTSTLMIISLAKEMHATGNDKTTKMMTRTIARLLLKTSRRSDVVSHYGEGVFAMLLTHTDTFSAQKASERLGDLVSNSNFFMGNKEIQLKISIGISTITPERSVEETIVCALEAMDNANDDPENFFYLCSKDK